MLNKIYYKLVRNKFFKWDPVKGEYQKRYSDKGRIKTVSQEVFPLLEGNMGSLKNKNILDLGGGAGNYTIKFLELGSRVTWADISYNMMLISKENLRFVQLENSEVKHLVINPNYIEKIEDTFDLIFLRLTWLYSFNDKEFAKKLIKKTKPGGFIYILTNNIDFKKNELSFFAKLKIHLYSNFNLKIGHPHPPVGKLKNLFKDFNLVHYKLNDSSEELLIQNTQ
tara:strand:+ start:354 stop:1025 length:672 start_codon:yes stop_codon:yes gene_type:complete